MMDVMSKSYSGEGLGFSDFHDPSSGGRQSRELLIKRL